MEIADRRSSSSSPSIRRSLRAHKASPEYRFFLERLVQQRETSTMSDVERRRLRLDKALAGSELQKLKRGEELNEFSGVMSLRDAFRGLGEVGE